MENYYDILEVETSAEAETIRRAYRRLSKDCHPDLHQGAPWAEKQFKRLNEAYSVLSDPQLRLAYDRGLQATAASAVRDTANEPDNSFTAPFPATPPAEAPGWRYAFFALLLLAVLVVAFTLEKHRPPDPARPAPPAAITTETLTPEQARFLELYRDFPQLISSAEAGQLLQKELAPGYTDRLWALLSSGDTTDFRLLIRWPEYYANEQIFEDWAEADKRKNAQSH